MSKHVRVAAIVDHADTPEGRAYVALLLKVGSRDDLGRPKDATLYYDEERIALEGGEEFLVVFARRDCVEPRAKGQA